MTQHLMHEHELEDQRTMRRLATVIGAFIIATAVMAVIIAFTMG